MQRAGRARSGWSAISLAGARVRSLAFAAVRAAAAGSTHARRAAEDGDDDLARRRRRRPANGGMTPIGGRPVQARRRRTSRSAKPVRPPAAKAPEMTVPHAERDAGEGRRRRRPSSRRPTRRAAGRRRAARKRGAGSAVAETGARGQGFGLSTGGGAGSGSTLDVADFCCPDYLVTDGRAHPAQLEPAARSCRRSRHDQVHDPARRHASPTPTSSSRAAHCRSIIAALRAVIGDAAAAAAARRVSQSRR